MVLAKTLKRAGSMLGRLELFSEATSSRPARHYRVTSHQMQTCAWCAGVNGRVDSDLGGQREIGVRCACGHERALGVRAHARPHPSLIYIIHECGMYKYIDIMFHIYYYVHYKTPYTGKQ